MDKIISFFKGLPEHFKSNKRLYLQHFCTFVLAMIICGVFIAILGGYDIFVGFFMGFFGYDLVFDKLIRKYLVKDLQWTEN